MKLPPTFLKWNLPLGNKLAKTCRCFLVSVLVGIVGAVLCLTPMGLYLEEEWGQSWLFSVRGPTSPPKDIVIISVDQTTSEILHLPDDPEKWPRGYYARLIDLINEQHPAIIALNVVFSDPRDEVDDQHLAQAMILPIF